MNTPEEPASPVDRMLEWLEALPATNLHATVFLGEDVMEFDQTNWRNLTGFGRCADDRFNGEIIIRRTAANGEETIAGLLLDGEWFALAPSGVKNDHGAKYSANSNYVCIDEMFPDCPVCWTHG
jgi:hypothetical protein